MLSSTFIRLCKGYFLQMLSRAAVRVVVALLGALLVAPPGWGMPDLIRTAGYSLDPRDDVVTLLAAGLSVNAVAKRLGKSWTHVAYTRAKWLRDGTTVSLYERGQAGRTGRKAVRTDVIDHFLAFTVIDDPSTPGVVLRDSVDFLFEVDFCFGSFFCIDCLRALQSMIPSFLVLIESLRTTTWRYHK